MHGFDEFFGNLYHLNAEEEPEQPYWPKDPNDPIRKHFTPRGVLKCKATDKDDATVDPRFGKVGKQTDPKDLEQAHALQDAIEVEQPGGPGKFEVPNWDQASREKIADALTVLGATSLTGVVPPAAEARSIELDM